MASRPPVAPVPPAKISAANAKPPTFLAAPRSLAMELGVAQTIKAEKPVVSKNANPPLTTPKAALCTAVQLLLPAPPQEQPAPTAKLLPPLTKSATYAIPHPYAKVNVLIKSIISPSRAASGNAAPPPAQHLPNLKIPVKFPPNQISIAPPMPNVVAMEELKEPETVETAATAV